MAKDFDTMEDSNPSSNPSIHEISNSERRQWLQMSFGAAASGLFAPWLAGCATSGGAVVATGPKLGFKGVPVSRADAVSVPEGYVAQPMLPWGDPVGLPGNMPAWKDDASNTAIAKGAIVTANARVKGQGGTIAVWSDQTTRFDGRIEARGGPKGGNGGSVDFGIHRRQAGGSLG